MTLDFLTEVEQIALTLQDMYHKFGFQRYKINKFEPYSFYMEKEQFLSDNRILTFSGPNGKLMALKPDVTMSIVKSALKSPNISQKIYYNESVFRIPVGDDAFRETQQLGVEYIGILDSYQMLEILLLAGNSLEQMSPRFRLCLSSTALVALHLEALGLSPTDKATVLTLMKQKNCHDLERFFAQHPSSGDTLSRLLTLSSNVQEATQTLGELFGEAVYQTEREQLCLMAKELVTLFGEERIYLDFSHISSTEYYNGIVFSGYVEGLAQPAVIGGRYDNLLRQMGNATQSALGFAVDLSALGGLFPTKEHAYEAVAYPEDAQLSGLIAKAQKLYQEGKTFCVKTESFFVSPEGGNKKT